MRQSDDFSKKQKRTPRYLLQNSSWYFKTREDGMLGPYNSVEETVQGVENYIQLMEFQKLTQV